MPMIVHDSGGGMVFEDDAGLLAAMERLLAEPALRDELGHRAHQSYTARLTPDTHVEAYLQVIARLREARRSAPAEGELPAVQEAV
jgi:glycosyltransferase involved in cell wall biosynthesis